MPKILKFDYPYIEDFGAKTQVFLSTHPENQEEWTAFNPSIGYSPELGYAILVRSSNYVISEYGVPDRALPAIRNELWFSELDENLQPTNLRKISITGDINLYQGVEDARLFWRDGAWHFSAVTVLVNSDKQTARVSVFKLSPDDNRATHLKQYSSHEPSRSEKNWMPVAVGSSDNFDFIYGPSGVVKDEKFILYPSDDEIIEDIRGGSCLWTLGDGTYLAVTHNVYYTEKIFVEDGETFRTHLRNYTHQFVHYDAYGKVVEISDEFVFDGPGIEFAAGLVEKDGNFIISYGHEDESAHLAIIPVETVLRLLGPVGEDFD